MLFLVAISAFFLLLFFYFTTPFTIKKLSSGTKQDALFKELSTENPVDHGTAPDIGQNGEQKRGEDIRSTAGVPQATSQAQLLPGTVKYHSRPGTRGTKLLDIVVEGVPMEMVFDTGADLVVFNSDAMHKLTRLRDIFFRGPR